jgi:hypothetical protein
LPRVQNPRVDLLGESPGGVLWQIELQSTNVSDMPLRMSEYCLGIVRQLGRFPQQVLLYVGQEPMSMAAELRGPRQLLEWDAVDIRDLDAERLLDSRELSDNVLAILARLRDEREAVRRIVSTCAALDGPSQAEALQQLVVLSGLRKMEDLVEEETHRMPVYIDLGANKILGPAFRKGLDEGRQAGELIVLRRLIQKRFGKLPEWAEVRLQAMDSAALEELSDGVLDAATLNELFPNGPVL